MRILVITPGNLPVPPIKGGSVETVIDEAFNRIATMEAVTIIGCKVENLRLNRNYKLLQVPYIRESTYLESLIRDAIQNEYDIIQVENRPTYIPRIREAFPNTPIILSLHSLTFMDKLANEEAESILSKVDGVLTVSHFITQTMGKRFPAYSKLFYTNHLGVDSNKFSPKEIKEKRKIRKEWKLKDKANYPQILYVGRIVPKKGLHTLIAATALLKPKFPKISLIIVGASWPGKEKETQYIRQIRIQIRKLKIPAYFTGYIPPAKMSQIYQLGDIFVCPTQFQEGLPMVNMEAMASGIPVISANRGGINEVIQNGRTGILVDKYKSPKAYAQEINHLLVNQGFTKDLVKKARTDMVSNFSWDKTVESLKNYYLQLSQLNTLALKEEDTK